MALNFEDIKDQLSNTWRNSWEQIQESSLFNQTKDRFENLSPLAQKLSLVGIAVVATLIMLSFPWGYFTQSGDNISEFETKRSVIRDLLKVSREANDNPDIPVPPPLDNVRLQIENFFKTSQLMPEQIKGIEMLSEKSDIVPANLSLGLLRVSLAKLNLRQIVDIGYQIQAINPSLKVKDMAIEANTQNPKYFDVAFKVIALNVPQEIVAPPEPPEPPKKEKRKPKKETATDD